jgi:hypothetical protein
LEGPDNVGAETDTVAGLSTVARIFVSCACARMPGPATANIAAPQIRVERGDGPRFTLTILSPTSIAYI